MKKSKDIEVLTDCGRCSLIIHEVYLEDAGDYVCQGKNEHGTVQTSCHLTVERTSTSDCLPAILPRVQAYLQFHIRICFCALQSVLELPGDVGIGVTVNHQIINCKLTLTLIQTEIL